ncbi:hypothetical protein WKI68_10940 [Streptomyces sp. MS1.HAVA.3]|uniref:Uncharacterized protein n=1 Tax=Streptomyces caledonius TaxID=3134107 RepID=A0ABU8U2C4_9ACTN
MRGLVRTHRPDAEDPGSGPLESVLVPGGVELRWPPGTSKTSAGGWCG